MSAVFIRACWYNYRRLRGPGESDEKRSDRICALLYDEKQAGCTELSFAAYLPFFDWTGCELWSGKRGSISANHQPGFWRLRLVRLDIATGHCDEYHQR